MLSDIVSEFLDARTDVEIVAVLHTTDPLDAAVLRYHPEMVIVSDAEFRVPAAWLDLLEAHPGLRLLAVASEGHRGALCEVIGNVPPQDLATIVVSRGRGQEPPVRGS